MKKITALFFLLIIILNLTINQEKTEPVFNELTSDHYLLQEADTFNVVYLDVSKINVTTKNYNLVSNLDIIGVYYEVNKLYERLFKTNYYEFKTPNIKRSFNNLNDYYLTILNQNSLIMEQNKSYIYGIKISKIKTYISNEKLYYLLKDNPKITYSLELNNNYQDLY